MSKTIFKDKTLWLLIIVCVALFVAYEILFTATMGGYVANIITYICLFVISGQGWNLLGGYIGEISFGHAAFFGIGAYTVAIMQRSGFEGNPLICVAVGMIITALFSWIISYPLLRIRGFSFLIGTFGLGIIFYDVFKTQVALGSNQGMYVHTLPRPMVFTLIVILAIVVTIFCYILVNTDLGLKFKAVRDASDAAEMIGINIYRTKTIALVIGAGITALAGGMFALYSAHINPANCYSVDISTDILLGSYIGGCGTIIGPVVGAFAVLGLQEWARNIITVSGGHKLLLGLLLIVVMLAAREGIWPAVRDGVIKLVKKSTGKKTKLKKEATNVSNT